MSGRIDKAELISKLKTLPGLSDEERSNLIGLLRQHKKYGIVWEDKPEDAERLLEDHLPVLKEVKGREILSDSEAPNHILIEGDNLHALTALSYTHAGTIDVIYIDPPYNTGNKDFVYNDSYVDSEDAYRHSKWLSFMSKRLKIAKKLLSDKGVIFISIDDNEQANIKLLCDEVFGENNFIAQLIWQQGKKHIVSFIGVNHEYMLVYAKYKYFINDNHNKWHQRKEGLDRIYQKFDKLKKEFKTDYNSIEKGLKDFYDSLPESDPAYGSKHYSKVDSRGIFFPDNISQGTGNGPRYDILHPITGCPVAKPAGGWRYSFDTMEQLLQENRIYFGEDETKVPCRKRYLKETEYELPCSVFYRDGRGATKEVATILGALKFDHPKDRKEIARILNFRQNNIILDFFAGSGTTLHATMQLNAEDGGHRQCILVTNNENNICEEVTYERNKRVINGYTTPKGVKVEGLSHNNLRYYKTEFVSRDRTVKNMRALVAASTDLLCIKENIYLEQKGLGNLPTNNHVYRYFEEHDRRMLVIYQEEFIPAIVEELRRLADDIRDGRKDNPLAHGPLKVYVFSPDRDPYADEFLEVEDYVELCALPAAIYDAYMQVLPRKKDKAIEVNEEQVVTEEDEWEA